MKFDPATPPGGTVRDWLDARAESGGTAMVFPETNDAISWATLRDGAATTARGMAGMSALVSVGSLAMVSKFSNSQFWAQAEDRAVTWFSVVPTIISHLLHGDSDPSDLVKARLRIRRSACSALAVETQSAFEARFGVPIIKTMGLTETAAQILSNPLPPAPRKIGSSGIPFGNSVRILANTLNEAPRGDEGEIAVRGPNMMKQ